MAISTPTGRLYHDTRESQKTKDDKYPAKINVYYLGKNQPYSLRRYFTKEEWEKMFSKKLRDQRLKEEKTKLEHCVGEMFQDALQKIEEPFTFQKFRDAYFKKNEAHLASTDMYALWAKRIAELEKEAKDDDESGDNVQIYKTAMNSFKGFRKRLSTSQVTAELLKQYEKNMTRAGLSVAYISINQRTLKAVWNWAKREGHIKSDGNPFANYTIKKSSKKNVALNENELRTLRNYEPQTEAERRAYLFWWFLFYCNGINIKDACLLKRKNIDGDTIEIRRAKTRRTNQSEVFIRFKFSKKIEAIIDELGNNDESEDAFVFNILRHGLNYKDTRRLVQNHTDVVNKYMTRIGTKLEIPKKIKTNVARHSFATYLYRRGTSIGVISEALGHSSIQTTRLYLASFDDETLQKTAALLDEI
jgi:integrase